MNDLNNIVNRVVTVSNKAQIRLPNMPAPLFCTTNGTCLYPDNVSISKYSICDSDGSCNPLPGCTSSNVYAMDIQECVPLNTPCQPVEATDSKRTYGYAANGTCSELDGCVPGWDWTGGKCLYTKRGEKCKTPDSTELVDRVWRYNDDGECLPTRECTSGVYSIHADRCVMPGSVCGQSVAHRVQEYDELGECVLASRCDANWQLVEQTCQWMDRGRVCKATAEELANDNKRLFQYDVMGACLPTNMCIDNWDLDPENNRCVYRFSEQVCNEMNNRIHRYNKDQECVPAECKSGWTLRNNVCTFDRMSQECDRQDEKIYTFSAAGACEPSGKCVDKNAVMLNGRCVIPGSVCGQSVAHRVQAYNDIGECALASRCDDDWDFDPETNRCVYRFSEQTCDEMNNRIHRYNKDRECVPAECKSGWTLRNNVCTFDRMSQECDRQDEQIYTFSAAGTCEPSGKCVDGNAVMLNGRCYVARTGCPEGFTSQGGECYRVFHLGGEGRSSVSFVLNPNDKVRATYNFQKERKYNDGDFDVSTNFGLNGSRSNIRDRDSISSSWMSGLTQCVLNSRQNDGHATLEVWVKQT